MRSQVVRRIAILGLFVLAMANAQAQTPSRVEANIPFDFAAGKATLKAGTYSIKRLQGTALALRSADGRTITLLNAPLTIGSRDAKAGERLVFNRYGDQYFLSQVWLSVDSGRQLFPSGLETKAAREYRLGHNHAKPDRIDIAVR